MDRRVSFTLHVHSNPSPVSASCLEPTGRRGVSRGPAKAAVHAQGLVSAPASWNPVSQGPLRVLASAEGVAALHSVCLMRSVGADPGGKAHRKVWQTLPSPHAWKISANPDSARACAATAGPLCSVAPPAAPGLSAALLWPWPRPGLRWRPPALTPGPTSLGQPLGPRLHPLRRLRGNSLRCSRGSLHRVSLNQRCLATERMSYVLSPPWASLGNRPGGASSSSGGQGLPPASGPTAGPQRRRVSGPGPPARSPPLPPRALEAESEAEAEAEASRAGLPCPGAIPRHPLSSVPLRGCGATLQPQSSWPCSPRRPRLSL